MKTIKIFFTVILSAIVFTSCYQDDYYPPNEEQPISLEMLLTDYELWYVDYHATTGTGDIPFMSFAFTLSFRNGRLYANNNLVGIGSAGSGFGIPVGYYNTYDIYSTTLTIDHDLDGVVDFEVRQLSNDQISLYSRQYNVTYYLEGYQRNNFDYDKVFYDNIEYFLQEYVGWEKTYRSISGAQNDFDNENYLAFTPENITTFYSSIDDLGLNIGNVFWDYVGDYEIFDVAGYDNFKILTLDYDLGYNEEFELVVLDDGTIELYHVNSGTFYEFTGRDFILIMKEAETKKDDESVSIEGRKRTKVKRNKLVREKHLR
ncbi:MAG: hypothetical protein PSN34_00560 [Urechidicola sp.]|nr:hypothetical protein [Urechidicola sp.]